MKRISLSVLLCFAMTAAEGWIAVNQVESSPITYLQGNLAQSTGQISSMAFKKDNTVGSTLLVAVSCQIIQAGAPSGDVTITDSAGNSYAKVTSSYDAYKPAQNVWQYNSLFYAVNTKGTESEKLTVDIKGYYAGSSESSHANYCTVVGEEFTSAGSTIVPDDSAFSSADGTYSSLGTKVTLTGSPITPTAGGDLIYSILFDDSSSNTSDTFTAGTGFSLMQSVSDGPIGYLADEYSVQSSASGISPTFGFSSPSARGNVAQQWTILSAAFKTTIVSLPVVSTLAVTGITETSATANGSIVSSGTSEVAAEGFVYGTTSVRTTPGNVAPGGSGYAGEVTKTGSFGNGEFDAALDELTENTTYYIRAFCRNSSGYSYGAEVNFYTLSPTGSEPSNPNPDRGGRQRH